MALSMDEQRMLAEIERRLAAQDPGLASRMSAFRRPGPAVRLRTGRGKIVGWIAAIALLAVIGVTAYASISFRAPAQKLTNQTTATSSSSAHATSSTATNKNLHSSPSSYASLP
jgi:Protein of unknown function (DUF3040)